MFRKFGFLPLKWRLTRLGFFIFFKYPFFKHISYYDSSSFSTFTVKFFCLKGRFIKYSVLQCIYILCVFHCICYYLVTVYSGQGFFFNLKPIAMGKFLLPEMSSPLLPHNKRILSFWELLASLWNMDRLLLLKCFRFLFFFSLDKEEEE